MGVLRLNPLEVFAEAKVFDVAHDGRVVRVDVVVEALERLAADGEGDHLAADFVAAFEDGDLVAALAQHVRGGQSRDTRSDNSNLHCKGTCSASTFVMRLNETPKLQRKMRPRIVVGTRITP